MPKSCLSEHLDLRLDSLARTIGVIPRACVGFLKLYPLPIKWNTTLPQLLPL